MMIEVKYIYILIYVFYICSTRVATATETLEQVAISADRKQISGERTVEESNKLLAEPADRFQRVQIGARSRRSLLESLGGDLEEEENQDGTQIRRNINNHRRSGRIVSDRFRRLSESQSIGSNQNINNNNELLSTSSKVAAATALTSSACERFLTFWNQFRDVYPSLATHLVSLSDLNVVGGFKLVAGGKLSWQLVKQNIARHLEEAERLAQLSPLNGSISIKPFQAITDAAFTSTTSASLLQPAQDHSRAGWLSRVTTNPFYAKLVQYIQQQQQQQQQHSKLRAHHQSQASRERTFEQVATNRQEAPDSHVYGRVVHFPHELNGGSNSAQATSKTLDKLRQLNQKNRQHLQQQYQNNQQLPIANEIDRTLTLGAQSEHSNQDQEVESNRIQVPLNGGAESGGDGRPWRHSPADNTGE